MSSTEFHLAQINVARMRAPLDDPAMAGFVDGLEPINALADASPGFVWRLATEEDDATAIRVFEDDFLLVNLSVWENVGALREFVYRTSHARFLKDRLQWFERPAEAHFALWWLPAGKLPALEEARARLEGLRRDGPTAQAFDFARAFSAPCAGRD